MIRSRESGTEWVLVNGEDREVPCFVPDIGQSINDVAQERRLRILGRCERGGVVAVISDNGTHFRAVPL